MYVLDNPFFILNATPSDDRNRIAELSEERSLFIDADKCSEARLNLMNPKRRLTAEISWFPGTPQKTVDDLLLLLKPGLNGATLVPKGQIDGYSLNPISEVNFRVSCFMSVLSDETNLSNHIGKSDILPLILKITEQYENINISALRVDINKSREMSKFAPVEDNQSLEEAMAEQRIFYRSTIKEILDTFETRVLVPLIKDLINSATDHGTTITPILLSDIMDVYEIESQRFHEIEESNILECLSSIRAANTRSNSESQVKSIFDILNDLCDNWYFITEPLHVYSASKGIFHSKSKKILDSMRSLSIETSDNFGNHELSLRLIKLCYRIFYNFMDTRKILREDMLILDKKINVTRKNILDDLKHDVNFAKDISYRVIPNDSSTNVFSMSPNGISYNNQHFNLDTIESVRWGGNVITTNYGSHSRKHAELKIIIRNENSRTMNIMVNRESIFQEITKRLHYSVGLPFILESLNELKKGRSYDFGDMTLRNSLISVKHKNLIMDTEVTYNWSEITVKPEAGNFVIYANNRSNPLITLPYLHIENIVFIGPIIQKACEKNVKKLSDLSSMM